MIIQQPQVPRLLSRHVIATRAASRSKDATVARKAMRNSGGIGVKDVVASNALPKVKASLPKRDAGVGQVRIGSRGSHRPIRRNVVFGIA